MSSICLNMPHSTPYGYEEYYQPPPQVNDNVSMDKLTAQISALTTQQPSQMEEFMMTYMQKTESYLQNQQVILDNLEYQMSQLSQQVSERSLESLPSNIEKEELYVREELEHFENSGDGMVESAFEMNHVDEIPYEDVVLDECDLVDILEAIDPFDNDEKLEQELALVSSSHDLDLLHEEDVEEQIQILEEKNGEVDSNIEEHDYEPSPIIEEMGRGEYKLKCLEIPKYSVEFDVAPIIEPRGYIVEFLEAPIQKLHVYVIEFEEEQDFDSELHGEGRPGKIRGDGIQIDLLWFRRELPQMAVKLWEWDTFPWDPGGYYDSQADDYKPSAPWEAAYVYFQFICFCFILSRKTR